jgi:hypothetical protein
MKVPSIVRIFLGAGAIALLSGLLPYFLMFAFGGHAGSGSAGTTANLSPETDKALIQKSGSTGALNTFIGTCGSKPVACGFKPGTTLIISAECDCASRRFTLNAATLRKIIGDGTSTPLGTAKLITTQNSNEK